MLRNNFTFTKQQLGLLLLIGGIGGFIVILAVDIVDAGREGGIGPVQRVALGGMIALALLGFSLIFAGDSPA